MFFCLPYECQPAGLYSLSHLTLFVVTVSLIALALYHSRNMTAAGVRRTIRVVTAVLWVLEIAKILFVLLVTGSRNPNDFVPLYYCSLVLYAGLISSVARGRVRYISDSFLATASLVGGLTFLLFPTTSLPRYPMIHFISFHSFILHGLMVYLALLMLIRRVYRIRLRDIYYPAILISLVSAAAFAFNTLYDRFSGESVANLMFLSKDFPGTPITLFYHLLGPILFPLFMWLIQAFVPFLLVYGGVCLVERICGKKLVLRDEKEPCTWQE